MPDNDGGTATLLKDLVPQEFHGEEYVKPWLDKPANDKAVVADIFKKLVNGQQLIGKRPQIPAKDAPEAEWDKFLAGIKPDKADDYVVPTAEGVKLDERGTSYQKALREAMLFAGAPKLVAERFFKKMAEFGAQDQKDLAAKSKIAQEKAKSDFDAAAKAALGDKREEIMARVRGVMEELAPAAFKPKLAKLDDETLVTVAGTINAILEKYVPADQLSAKAGSTSTGDKDEEKTLQDEATKIQSSAEYKDAMHPDAQKFKDRLKTIFGRIAEIREEKKKGAKK